MKNEALSFKVGDEVTVHTGFGGFNANRRIARIARVLKSSVVLDDEQKTRWTLDGRPKPRRTDYRQPHIKHTTEVDRVYLIRHACMWKIDELCMPSSGVKMRVADLSTDQLQRIVAILEENDA